MKFNQTLATLLALTGMASSQATAVVNLGAFTLSYNDTTTSFGTLAYSFSSGGGVTGFAWNVQDVVQVISFGAATSAVFVVPDFTITTNPGWSLSGPLISTLGNIVFNEVGGSTTTATAVGSVSVDGGPLVAVGGALARTVTTSVPSFVGGYYADTVSAPFGGFSTLSVAGATLTLTAGGGTFSSVIGQTQNELKYSLIANPVPEPETAALLLAGLLTVGTLARRRG